MTFSDRELERYARQLVLAQVGGVGQQRLKSSRVLVVGAGGIGSALLPALAGAGIGTVTIVDDGLVELTNLHRQPLYAESDIGRAKAPAAADFARTRNSEIAVVPISQRLDRSNAHALLAGHDLVIDGSDNFATRLAVADVCVALQMPLISAAAIQFQAQVGLWLGHQPDQPCYRCFVGEAFDAEDCDNCAELGVLPPLVGTAGHFAALMAIHVLLGGGEEGAGRIHLFDGLSMGWRQVRAPKDPRCRTCGGIDAPDS